MTQKENEFKVFKKEVLRFFEPSVSLEVTLKEGGFLYVKENPTLASQRIDKKSLEDERVERLDERKKYWTKTFVKWGLLALGLDGFICMPGVSPDELSCGLCNKFLVRVKDEDDGSSFPMCHHLCPVRRETGKMGCKSTPYIDYIETPKYDSKTQAMHILREIAFLCRLCREDFAKSYKNT